MNTTAIAALIILHLLCWPYACLVEYTRHRWPASKRYTFAWVVGGVMMTVAAASVVIGLQNALWMAAFFVASGIPMAVGAMLKHTWLDDRTDQELEAREQLRNGLA